MGSVQLVANYTIIEIKPIFWNEINDQLDICRCCWKQDLLRMVDSFQLELAQSLRDSGKLCLTATSDNAVIHTSTGGRLQMRPDRRIRCTLIHLTSGFLRRRKNYSRDEMSDLNTERIFCRSTQEILLCKYINRFSIEDVLLRHKSARIYSHSIQFLSDRRILKARFHFGIRCPRRNGTFQI